VYRFGQICIIWGMWDSTMQWIGILSEFLSILNRRWHISKTPNTTKKLCALFKLMQPSNMVTLSCLAKKNQILNLSKKSSVYYWKSSFQATNFRKSPFSVINWTFFPRFWFLFARQFKATIIDSCISLIGVQKILVVLWVVDRCHLLLKPSQF
jgi:hypothetical protein